MHSALRGLHRGPEACTYNATHAILPLANGKHVQLYTCTAPLQKNRRERHCGCAAAPRPQSRNAVGAMPRTLSDSTTPGTTSCSRPEYSPAVQEQGSTIQQVRTWQQAVCQAAVAASMLHRSPQTPVSAHGGLGDAGLCPNASQHYVRTAAAHPRCSRQWSESFFAQPQPHNPQPHPPPTLGVLADGHQVDAVVARLVAGDAAGVRRENNLSTRCGPSCGCWTSSTGKQEAQGATAAALLLPCPSPPPSQPQPSCCSPEAGAHVGVQLQLLAEREVEGAEALADGGGHGALQADAVALQGVRCSEHSDERERGGGARLLGGDKLALAAIVPCPQSQTAWRWPRWQHRQQAAGQRQRRLTSTESRFSRVTNELVRGSTSLPMCCTSHWMGACGGETQAGGAGV